NKMKKKFLAIIILILLFSLPCTTAYATVGPAFYYDNSEPTFQAFAKTVAEKNIFENQFAEWIQRTEQLPEDEVFDPQKISFDHSKAVWMTGGWTKETAAEFFDQKDPVAYLHQHHELKTPQSIYIPAYYDGTLYPYVAGYYYHPDSGQYSTVGRNAISSLKLDLVVEERLQARLKEWGLNHYVPQHIMTVEAFTFVLCRTQDQTIAVYVPTDQTVRYFEEYDQKFSKQRTFTKEQLITAIAEYEIEARIAKENAPSQNVGGVPVYDEEPAPRNNTLWWMIGGAVILVGIAVTITLILAKKKA
ncbi:MAG: hypothetical protein IJN42_02675, partial [Clostridia bacterium]|nr:hypothetical protein [Clostridia bacterium]